MKNVIILLCSFLAGSLQAQDQLRIPIEKPSNYSVRTWGSDSVDQGVFLIPDEKSFLMAGVTYSNKLPQIALNKIGSDMNLQWAKVHRYGDFRFPYSGSKTPDGNYIFSGFIRKMGERQLDALLFKTNTEGDTLWTTTLGGPKEERAYAVLPTKHDCYLVAGLTSSWGNGNLDGLIAKFSGEGKMLWKKTYGEEKLDKLYNLTAVKNGDFIASGITNDNYPKDSDILLIRITAEGEVVWKKTITSPKGEFPTFVTSLKNNRLFIAGHTLEKNDSLGSLLFMSVDATSGNVLSKNIVQTNEDIKLEHGMMTKTGDFVGIGFVRKGTKESWDVVLVKYVLATGSCQFSKIEFSEFHDEVYNIQFADDYYFIAGQTMANKGDNLLIKWKGF